MCKVHEPIELLVGGEIVRSRTKTSCYQERRHVVSDTNELINQGNKLHIHVEMSQFPGICVSLIGPIARWVLRLA